MRFIIFPHHSKFGYLFQGEQITGMGKRVKGWADDRKTGEKIPSNVDKTHRAQ